jgi:saccharopine dehydrogenase-like NADP-dependent oxidoreductase
MNPEMKPNVLIVGAGAVAHVAAHKAAQNNDILGNICIASRTKEKAEQIIESIKRKGNIKDKEARLYAREIDALDIPATMRLIEETESAIVVNLGTAFINMSVLEACIRVKTVNGRPVTYMDTAIHEDPAKVAEDPPWYANYEWKKKAAAKEAGINAILGVGFDPGVVNAWAALAVKRYFDKIDTIDILDVNAGSHGKYFATNFDPEINFREFKKVWTWINRKWVERPVHSERWDYDFPVVGSRPVYLNGHDELHSLSKNIDAKSIRFWMGFGDHYLNVYGVLRNLGMLSEKPVTTAEGVKVVPLKVLKAVLPDPASLAKTYTGWTCIADLVKGWKDGKWREVLFYNNCNHAKCYREVESQAISYTAGVPPIAAAILVARGEWAPHTMVNVEELDPEPFLKQLGKMGLPTKVEVRTPKSGKPSKDGMPVSATKSNSITKHAVW